MASLQQEEQVFEERDFVKMYAKAIFDLNKQLRHAEKEHKQEEALLYRESINETNQFLKDCNRYNSVYNFLERQKAKKEQSRGAAVVAAFKAKQQEHKITHSIKKEI